MEQTRRSMWFKLLSVVMTVAILAVSLPLTVFGMESLDAAEAEAPTGEAPEVWEVVELRGENVKHFRLSDGSYVAARYSGAVHELDGEGKWQDIDNTLTETLTGYKTENARVKFAKNSNASKLFSLKDGEYGVSFGLADAARSRGVVKNGSNESGLTGYEALSTLSHLVSSVRYADVYESTDLEYVVRGRSVKENIILKSGGSASYSYTFEMKVKGLTPTLGEDGSVTLADSDTGKGVYRIPAPYMYDAAGKRSEAVSYTLTGSGNKYKLTVTADAAWINAADRAFPVTIDPTVSRLDFSLDFVHIESSRGNCFSEDAELKIGYSGDTMILGKITDMSFLPDESVIVSAKLQLSGRFYYACESMTVQVGNIIPTEYSNSTGDLWNFRSVKHSDYRYSFDIDRENVIDYAYLAYGDHGVASMTLDITELVMGWAEGSIDNQGFAVYPVAQSGEEPAYLGIQKTEESPMLEITYRDAKGIEEYYDYFTASAGSAGTGYVNAYTGQLQFLHDLLSTTDSLLPYTLGLAYNGHLSGRFYTSENAETALISAFAGKGMKLYCDETVTVKLIKDSSLFIWSDADGTEHHFPYLGYFSPSDEQSLTVEDEDDLHLTLKVEKPEDGALFFEISDEVGNKKHFDTNGYLVYIEDAVGNRRVFTRDANHRVTAISLVPKGHSEISQLTLTYSGGLLSGVTNIVAGISAALSYNTDGYLTAITYTYPPDGSATVTFAYDGAGRLTLAKDEKGCRALGYSYDDSGRVIEVTEYAFADASSEMTAGQRAGISYATRQTVYRTAGKDDVFGNGDDVYAVYGFNMSGKLVSAYTTDGATVYGAGNYEYDGESNRISSVMSTGGMTVNHLANPGFDSVVGVMPLLWETSGTVYSRFSVTDFSENRVAALSASGNGSSTAAIKQKFHLAEGTYTFSARLDMHAMYTAQGGVRLVIYREDGSAISEGYVRNRMVNQGGQETYSWETVHVTFAVTGTACEAQGWYAAIELYHPEAGSSSAVYVDSAMLETGSVVSAYSSVHGSFDSGASDWTGGTVVSGESLDGTRALCVTGNVLQARRASITVHLEHGLRIESDSDTGRTQKPATLVLSGWAKANAVPNGARAGHEGGSLFGLRAVVHYYDTNATTTHEATFTTSVEDWQFISLDICPMYDTVKHGFYGITSIDIYCVYDYNVGNAYFDNISLIRDSDCVVNYFYNADGKIVGTSTSDSNSESYTYAENGVDVERVTDELGNEYDYGYDGQHRVETSVNASGNVVYDPDVEYSGIYSIDYTNYTVYSVYDDEGNYGNLMKTYQIGKYNRTMLESSVTYNYSDAAFSAVATETDAAGGVTRYFYRNNGLLHGMCDPNGNGLVYSYNAFGQLTRAVAATYDAATNTLVVPEQGEEQHDVTYSYDGKGQLTGIDSDGALYTFLYDVFGNATEVRLGSDVLATYEYAANNGKLKRMSYGNGTYVLYEYDAVDRVVGICYNGRETAVYSYFYNANGQVAEHTDLATGICYEYNYDASGRMLQETAKKSNASDLLYFRELEYDIYGRIVSHYVYFLDTPAAPLSLTEYAYNAQGNIGEVNLANISKLLTYSYDEHGRVSSKYLTNWTDHENRTVYLGQSFTYERGRTVQSPVDNGNAYTNTGHLKMHTIEDADGPIFISQDYDAAGNITEIRTATLGVLHAKAHFHYDKLGQLVREDQWFADTSTASFTMVYTYDKAGNMTSKKQYAYTASDTAVSGAPVSTTTFTYVGNMLTAINGSPLRYDAIGNLCECNGVTYKWNGRRFTEYDALGLSVYYTYNADGVRTVKTVNNVRHEYVLDGIKVMREAIYDPSRYLATDLRFSYDAEGNPVGMRCFQMNAAGTVISDNAYFYATNAQGDVIAIYSNTGTKLYTYTYDAWGNLIEGREVAAGGAAVGALNPLRYRGYYYDAETGLYYLNSRYYNPQWGRFLNADDATVITATPGALTDKNLYIYCDNNPVMRADDGGHFWDTVFDVVSLCFSVVDVIQNPDDPWAWVGLAADVASLVIPCVSGGSSVVKAATKADDAVDAVKAIDRVDDAVDTVKTGWHVGDDITNLTKAGNNPSWSTVRQRYWKNEALNHPERYSSDLDRLKKGLAPIGKDGFSMELHHPMGRTGKNFFNFEPLTQTAHRLVHWGG